MDDVFEHTIITWQCTQGTACILLLPTHVSLHALHSTQLIELSYVFVYYSLAVAVAYSNNFVILTWHTASDRDSEKGACSQDHKIIW